MSGSCPRLAFDLVARIAVGATPVAAAANRDACVAEALGGNGLVVEVAQVDAPDAGPWRFTVTREGSQTTEGDRAVVEQWIGTHPGGCAWWVGPLVDLGG